MISTANVNEDDLIRVDVNITPSIPGLTYSVQRNSSALKFWKNQSKSEGEHEFDLNTLSLTADGTSEDTEDMLHTSFYHGEMDDSVVVRSVLSGWFLAKVLQR